MHAVRLHAFGPAGNLTYEEVPDPAPAPGQVRIAVEAAGVHVLDTVIRAGVTGGPMALPELPTIPGREVAGTVDALGEGTSPDWLRRRVAVHLGMVPGGYASVAVADAAALQPVPDQLGLPAAVAMIGTGRTVMGVLREAEIAPGDTVLVLSAAGGMGALLVQYAKHHGARVIGAAGGEAKTALVRELGADLAVDYTGPDWTDRVREAYGEHPVRHLFDGSGATPGRAALTLLAPGSTRYAYSRPLTEPDGAVENRPGDEAATGSGADSRTGAAPTEAAIAEDLSARGITVRGLDPQRMMAQKRELETESLTLAAKGVLDPLVHTFPMAKAAAAHHALETRATSGKVVLIP
ncbi:zinc-binding dehydrogenase [Streptomyces iconiensis]|uniref:Zinc-binding dehydrogenase n=1 Tax=Streptomyces iconiensis TaxID=1384038 RepID=A0ABT7A937_9ACTN|nr:zinc-binding dehydrogenase [Streptomyces iconiensis]MDJ1137855.1 zinc-binding dehydrogenase [Streptomyces iconiensis]